MSTRRKIVLILTIILIEVGVSIVYREASAWTQVNTDGFGDSNNTDVQPQVVFDGYLYAGTATYVTGGGEIWRSSDGTTWVQVNTDGFGDYNNSSAYPWIVFNGYLYWTFALFRLRFFKFQQFEIKQSHFLNNIPKQFIIFHILLSFISHLFPKIHDFRFFLNIY